LSWSAICVLPFFLSTRTPPAQLYPLSLHDALPISKDWKVTIKEFEHNTSDILALIVDHDVTQLEQLLTDLRQWDIGIPVLLMGDADLNSMDPELRKMVISKFEFPPNYNKFLDNLYRAQVYREQFAASRARGQQREVQLFRSLVGTSRAIQRVRE